jgi:hypothetical protein
LILCLTGIRVVYLIAILSVNGHIQYFNGFLKRATNSQLLMVKLHQIEGILNKEGKHKLDKYLSIKYCIKLAFQELILDILIMPFIAAYFIVIPWRLQELHSIAVTQYERVPTKKESVNYKREINEGKAPKRV